MYYIKLHLLENASIANPLTMGFGGMFQERAKFAK